MLIIDWNLFLLHKKSKLSGKNCNYINDDDMIYKTNEQITKQKIKSNYYN